MKRAAEIFDVDERGSDCSLVEKVWAARRTTESEFLAVSETNWQIVVTTHRGHTHVVVQGPNDVARSTPIPEGAEFFGIVMRLGSFMPDASLARLVGGADLRSDASGGGLWLGGSCWEVPTADNADVFVERLAREEIVVQDRLVARAFDGADDPVSSRTLQRHVRRATGMTLGGIRQVRRAHAALDALGRGADVAEVVDSLGFADQPHLTRALRRFVGQTPAQVRGTGGHWSASSAVGGSVEGSVSFPFNTRVLDRP